MREIVTVMFLRKGRLFMTLRSADEPNYANGWTFPAGEMRMDENPEEAMLREMAEELKVVPVRFEEKCTLHDVDPTSKEVYKHHMFVVTKWKGRIRGCTEARKTAWFMPKKIMDINTFPVTFSMIARCLDKE